MKRRGTYVFLISVFAFMLVLPVNDVEACFNPTDSFATEVLLNKPVIGYDLSAVMDSEGVEVVDNVVIYRSHFNRDVAVVLTVVDEQYGSLKGLSVKIQIPVKEDPIKTPYVTVEGSVVTETPELDARVAEALGWSVKQISESETAIFKGNIYIQVDEAGKTESENVSRYDTFIQVRVGDAETLGDDVRAEIEEALIAIGLDSFKAILKDENVVVGFEEYTDLVPSVGVDPENFDWREAMKTELTWLRESDLVSGLTDRDIQDISSICGRGTAGHNSRIVYEEGWIPYNKTNNPLLLRDWDCGGFSAESLPEEDLGDLNDGSEAIPWTYPAAAIAIIAAVLSLLIYARRRA